MIDEAKETFELRRAAILDKAFRGELTAEWRKENNNVIHASILMKKINGSCQKSSQSNSEIGEILENPYELPSSWKWVNIDLVSTFVGSGSTPKGGKSVYQDEGIPFIRSQNVLKNEMNIKDIAYISEDIHTKMKRTQLVGNETLLNITGASIGRASKIKSDLVPSNLNQHVCAIRFVEEINTELPQFWFNSPFLQNSIMKMQVGVTREGLNFKQVRSLPFPLPPVEEQKEMVNKINKLINNEQKSNQLLLKLDNDINLLRQSILKKAFLGKLGTNDSTEESAIGLIKEVLK